MCQHCQLHHSVDVVISATRFPSGSVGLLYQSAISFLAIDDTSEKHVPESVGDTRETVGSVSDITGNVHYSIGGVADTPGNVGDIPDTIGNNLESAADTRGRQFRDAKSADNSSGSVRKCWRYLRKCR